MAHNRLMLSRPSQIFDTFMDEFFNAPSVLGAGGVAVDMFEDENNVYTNFKAPGFKREDVNIDIEGDMLTVSGQLKQESEEDSKKKYYMKEIREHSFSRSVSLPSKVDAGKASAKVEDGMIKITLPKLPEAKPKKIKISAE